MENPWVDLPQKAPYILDSDKEIIMRFNKSSSIETKFQLDYLPEPFQGDHEAPIVLLSLNPGFNEEGDSIHLSNEHFRKMSRKNLLHTKTEYPFYLLNPDFKESGGFKYWNRKLRYLIEEFSLKSIAEHIFVVEYYGYHSEKCGFGGELSSQQYNFDLVREAKNRDAVIVMLRRYNNWMKKVPELKKYQKKYFLNSPRAGTVSKKNCPIGYDVIREILKKTARDKQ